MLKVLIVAPPGYPRTIYCKHNIINNAYVSNVLSIFLNSMKEKQLWGYEPTIPRFIYGTGNGGNIAIHFCVRYIFHSKAPNSFLSSSIKGFYTIYITP